MGKCGGRIQTVASERCTEAKKYLDGIEHLTDGEVTPRQNLRETRKEVVYLMEYASGLGFVSDMWSQRSLI